VTATATRTAHRPDTASSGPTEAHAPSAPTRTPPQVARLDRRARAGLFAMLVAIDVALVGPLLSGPRLQLLDYGSYPVGPHPPVPLSSLGFPPVVTARAPVYAALAWLFHVAPAPVTLLPFVVLAPLACLGFARLLPGRAVAIGASTVLYSVNPFVYERMANGQVYVVMGYALLPVLLALVVRPLPSIVATGALGGLVLATACALSVHFLYLGVVALVVVALSHAVLRVGRVVAACAAVLASGLALSAYWLVPAALAGAGSGSRVTAADLAAFRTLGDARFGLAANVLGLYGFWRGGAPLVKDAIAGWPLLLVALLVAAAFGVRSLVRDGRRGRALAVSCLALGLVGALLAAGTQGPTGTVYSWAFAHVPGFRVMREPQKFAALLALAYAVAFGVGVEALLRPLTAARTRALAACALVALPLAYGGTELWGFSASAPADAVPPGLVAVDRAMRPGAVALALPFSAYLPVPWLGDRLVATPLSSAFAHPVVAGDDLEAGDVVTESADPRSAFLQFALTEGPRLHQLGRVLAPLGISYVVLAKAPGWRDYAWLARQRDLRLVANNATAELYASTEATPTAYAPRRSIRVRDWGAVLALAERAPLVDYLVHVTAPRPGPLVAPPLSRRPVTPRFLDDAGGSTVKRPVLVEAPVHAIVLTDPAFPGWRLDGYRTTSQFGATVAFEGPASARGIVLAAYGPWRTARDWDLIGMALLAADLAVLLVAWRWQRRRMQEDHLDAPSS
jgi:hypothetical protein